MLPASLNHTLTMRCDISRKGGDNDAWGHQNEYSTVSTDVKCYWYLATGDERVGSERTVVLTEENLIVEVGTDIKPGDRITRVKDMYGRIVFGSNDYREVKHVGMHRNHLNVSLDSSS